MDINCVSKCVYQSNGKCTLNQLQPNSLNNSISDDDCPYCKS